MKTISAVIIIIFSQLMFAQENDSTLCKYGLLFDYNNAIANAVGFKYRHNSDAAYFLRCNFSNEDTKLTVLGVDRSEGINTYKGSIGFEAAVIQVDNLSLLTIFAGGLTVTTYSRPYYTDQYVFTGNREMRIATYSFEAGLGAEYHFSRHLSLSGSQSITVDYSRDDGFAGSQNPATKKTTAVNIVSAKITLAFYL